MALVERTLISSFHHIPDIGDFIIHPEFLEDEELEYELRIRGELVAGNRRDLAAQLRKLIGKEQLNEREVPLTSYSVPSQELEHCQKQIPMLQSLLAAVDHEQQTQNRFMTKHIHVEGRLNRIPKANTTCNVTDAVFSMNEKLSSIYNEFLSKIKLSKKNKKNPATQINEENLLSQAMGGGTGLTDDNENVFKPTNKGTKGEGAQPPIINLADDQLEVRQNKKVVNDTFTNMGAKPRGGNADENLWFPYQNYNPEFFNKNKAMQDNEFDRRYKLPTRTDKQSQQGRGKDSNNQRLSEHFRQNGKSFSHIVDNQGGLQAPLPFPPATSSRTPSDAYNRAHDNFGANRRNSMPRFPQRPEMLFMRSNHSDRRQSPTPSSARSSDRHSSASERSRDAYRPQNRMENAIIELASVVNNMVERMGSVELRMGSIEQQNRTYTIQGRGENNANPNNQNVTQGNQVQANEHAIRARRVPINKWGFYFTANSKSEIPEEKDARAFLKRLEIFRDAEDVTYGEIFQKFHYLLKGNALDWFSQYRNDFTSWNDLKAGFLKQYTTPLSKFTTAAKLASRKQQRTESATEYIASILRDFDEMEVYEEEERVAIVQNGLLPELRNRAMSRDWRSVQELNIWLRKTEAADKLYEIPNQQQQMVRKFIYKRPTMAMSEVALEENEYREESPEDVNTNELLEVEESQCYAINNRNHKNFTIRRVGQTQPEAKQKKGGCYNCKSTQHYFNDCDQPVTRIFCFRCGKEETLAPNCDCKELREQAKNGMTVAAAKADLCNASNQVPL